MRFKEFYLTEVVVDDKYGRTANLPIFTRRYDGAFYKKYESSKLRLQVSSNVELREMNHPKNEHGVYYVIDDKPVSVTMYKFLDKKVAGFQKYPMVGFAYTVDGYEKKGYQKMLNRFLINNFGGILVDITLSNSGFEFYKKLSKDYYSYIFDNNKIDGYIKELDWNKIDKKDKNERIVITKNKVPEYALDEKFLGPCDRFRKTDENEKIWQEMMKNKKKISEKELLKNVSIEDILDEETWEDWKHNNSDDEILFFKSGDYYFIQVKGFEYIWKKDSK